MTELMIFQFNYIVGRYKFVKKTFNFQQKYKNKFQLLEIRLMSIRMLIFLTTDIRYNVICLNYNLQSVNHCIHKCVGMLYPEMSFFIQQ